MDHETEQALRLLRSDPELISDARIGVKVGNSVAGALLTRPLGPIGARQYAEAAVARALRLVDRRGRGA